MSLHRLPTITVFLHSCSLPVYRCAHKVTQHAHSMSPDLVPFRDDHEPLNRTPGSGSRFARLRKRYATKGVGCRRSCRSRSCNVLHLDGIKSDTGQGDRTSVSDCEQRASEEVSRSNIFSTEMRGVRSRRLMTFISIFSEDNETTTCQPHRWLSEVPKTHLHMQA